MATIRVRGGSFCVGTNGSFANDHFSFPVDESWFSTVSKIHVGQIARARMLDRKTESAGAAGTLGAAGIGALAGAWFGPPGMATGAVIGGIISIAGGKSSSVTFEMEFHDGRALVGTIDAESWAEILESWRISQYAGAIAPHPLTVISASTTKIAEPLALPSPTTPKKRWWPLKG